MTPPVAAHAPGSGRWAVLTRGHSLPAVILRFGFIGCLNAAVFFVGTMIGVDAVGLTPVWASLLGYAMAMPVGFFGHRRVSFRSRGHLGGEAVRFCVIQAINIGITLATMAGMVDRLRLGWIWGSVAVMVVVPVANFVMARLWVFRRADGQRN